MIEITPQGCINFKKFLARGGISQMAILGKNIPNMSKKHVQSLRKTIKILGYCWPYSRAFMLTLLFTGGGALCPQATLWISEIDISQRIAPLTIVIQIIIAHILFHFFSHPVSANRLISLHGYRRSMKDSLGEASLRNRRKGKISR